MPKRKRTDNQPDEKQAPELSPNIKLKFRLSGHKSYIGRIAWSPDGKILASPSRDGTIRLWNAETGNLLRIIKTNFGFVYQLTWSPDSHIVAANRNGEVKMWKAASGELVQSINKNIDPAIGYKDLIAWCPTKNTLAFQAADNLFIVDTETQEVKSEIRLNNPNQYAISWSPDGKILALADGKKHSLIKLISLSNINKSTEIEVSNSRLYDIAWSKENDKFLIATGGFDRGIYILDASTERNMARLEGHTRNIESLSFSSDGRLLASRANRPDDFIRIWRSDTWETIALIPQKASGYQPASIQFHPQTPYVLATLDINDKEIRIWELDLDALLGNDSKSKSLSQAIHHTTGKIVLVGDSGVGKTGLGWRLAHGKFKEHSSTHGQQFWVLNELGMRRQDGTECEAILWDLAGQPDYRLTHALFLDDADVAIVLFDPTDSRDPMHGVEFWLKQLETGHSKSAGAKKSCPTILVGARVDRGESRLMQQELNEFCRQRGIAGGYIATSAKEGIGLDELLERMKEQILWERKTTTVTTATFKRIKDYVLSLKESRRRRKLIVSPDNLRNQLEKTDKTWKFTDDEMMTAVRHLANYGYIRVLRTSQGEERILLVPELLNNLAASFVLEARLNPKGLGSLEEALLLSGGYKFRELDKLSAEEQNILLDSAALLFLEHNICFRETDPLGGKSYLVFPELINLKKPMLEDEQQIEDGVSYTVSGSVENVYASLVVLLGYTQTFTRTAQWQNQARYEMKDGLFCGFRQESERNGELDLVLYFGKNVGQPIRSLFQGLFESFLTLRNLNIYRYEPVICTNKHVLNRAVVREQLNNGSKSAFCSQCGERLTLPDTDAPIRLTRSQHQQIEEQEWFATRRSRFEQAVFQVQAYVEDQRIKRPKCFISYSWGDRQQERWVERNLATDLQKAGIEVLLDRWENSRVGANISRFIERIEECDQIIIVGSKDYRRKYDNKDETKGYAVAAEGDLISRRMRGTEAEKDSILPVLLDGDEKSSLPPLVQGRVLADFRNDRAYFMTAFDLILSIYDIPFHNTAVADLRESLHESIKF